MSYIGRAPTDTGEFRLIDEISSSFDGSTQSFDLKVGTLAITPTKENIIIALDGVLQDPSSAYTVSGSTIKFSEGPVSDTTFYGVLTGQVGASIANSTITNDHVSGTAAIDQSKLNLSVGIVSASAQLATDISGSLGTNAALIRSLTGAAISGSIVGGVSGSAASTGSFGSIYVGKNVNASSFVGDGSSLTGIDIPTAAAISGSFEGGGSTKISGSSTSTGSFGSVHTAGNVGIGTTSPANPFHVQVSNNVDMAAKIENTHATAGHGLKIIAGDSSSENILVCASQAGSDKLYVRGNGDVWVSGSVGIGTATPLVPLHVSSAAWETIRMQQDQPTLTFWKTDGSARMGYIQMNIDSHLYIVQEQAQNMIFRTSGGNDRMTIDSSGNIGAPDGTNIYNASDVRLKQNVTNLSGSLEKIKQMQGVSFEWIDGFCVSEKDKTHYGLIAQDLMHVDSNLVSEFGSPTEAKDAVIDDDGDIIEEAIEATPHILVVEDQEIETPLRVEDKYIIPILVESIKELSAKVEALEKE